MATTRWPPTAASSPIGPAFYGSTGGKTLNAPIVGMAATSRQGGLLAGGCRRRHLRLRERPFYGSDGRQASQRAHRGHGRNPERRAATSWWPPTAASSPTGMPSSTAPWAASPSTSRSWAWPRPSTVGGYFVVAADGGHLRLRDAVLPRLHGRQTPQRAGRGHGGRFGWRLLRGGVGRRPLRLRERPLPRIHGRQTAEQTGRRHARCARVAATTRWPRTAGSSPSGRRSSDPGWQTPQRPIVGMAG